MLAIFWKKPFKVYDTDSRVGEVWQINKSVTLLHVHTLAGECTPDKHRLKKRKIYYMFIQSKDMALIINNRYVNSERGLRYQKISFVQMQFKWMKLTILSK